MVDAQGMMRIAGLDDIADSQQDEFDDFNDENRRRIGLVASDIASDAHARARAEFAGNAYGDTPVADLDDIYCMTLSANSHELIVANRRREQYQEQRRYAKRRATRNRGGAANKMTANASNESDTERAFRMA